MNSDLTAGVRSGADLPPMPEGTFLTVLDNGLTIIVREDSSAPVVSAQAWCMTGSIHEDRWLGAGLSHVLEHMLFKGTATRPGSRIDQEVQEAGGYMNAYTSFDRTVYHIDVPSTGAATSIDILCDVMQHASLPADELEKEKQVILREMDMNVDDPQRRASRRLFETAFTHSPCRYTVIGYPDVFNTVTHADLCSYYREKYVPNNIFFVVAGDVRNEAVVARIRNAYAGSPSRPLPPFVLPEEPVQTGLREVIEEAPIELGYTHSAWHIPGLRHPDAPALEVLALILGSGRSSRLYRQVRERQALAHSVSAWTYNPGGQGLFAVSTTIDPQNHEASKRSVLAEIERLRTEPVPAAELSKAVKQLVSITLAGRKTMQGQAQDLGGSWMAANDLSFSERFLNSVQSVTPEMLLRVAREYLPPDRHTLYALLPTGTAPVRSIISSNPSEAPIQKVTLQNGLRLLIKEDHRLPFVEMRALFKGGVLAETTQSNGATQLMSKVMLKGTRSRTAEQIADSVEEVGGYIESYGGSNSFGINVEVLRPDFMTGMDVLADVILHPVFPQPEFLREREVQLAAIRSQKDHLLQSAFIAMKRSMFGPRHYGLDPTGTEESVQALTTADLAGHHSALAVPGNCVLSVFGDIDAQHAIATARNLFGAWAGNAPADLGIPPAAAALAPVQRVTEPQDKKQAVVVIGFPGLSLYDPRRYALELLQESCSDLGSRLFLRIREELGLAYFVGAQNFLGLAPGYFAFYAGTLPEKATLVEAELKREAGLLQTEGLTAEELKRAKAKVLGQRKIARQELGQQAMTAALDELYGLGFAYSESEDDFFQAVTLEDIRQVASAQLNLETHTVSVAGQIC